MSEKISIHDVPKLAQAVPRDTVNETMGFPYRSIDAIVTSIHPVLAEAGVLIIPQGIKILYERDYTLKSGAVGRYIEALVAYEIQTPDKVFTAQVPASAADSSDKVMYKILSGAYKNLLAQMFHLPYAQPVDVDEESPEVRHSPPVQESYHHRETQPTKEVHVEAEHQEEDPLKTNKPTRNMVAAVLRAEKLCNITPDQRRKWFETKFGEVPPTFLKCQANRLILYLEDLLSNIQDEETVKGLKELALSR
jgi:hypothetical protein